MFDKSLTDFFLMLKEFGEKYGMYAPQGIYVKTYEDDDHFSLLSCTSGDFILGKEKLFAINDKTFKYADLHTRLPLGIWDACAWYPRQRLLLNPINSLEMIAEKFGFCITQVSEKYLAFEVMDRIIVDEYAVRDSFALANDADMDFAEVCEIAIEKQKSTSEVIKDLLKKKGSSIKSLYSDTKEGKVEQTKKPEKHNEEMHKVEKATKVEGSKYFEKK